MRRKKNKKTTKPNWKERGIILGSSISESEGQGEQGRAVKRSFSTSAGIFSNKQLTAWFLDSIYIVENLS